MIGRALVRGAAEARSTLVEPEPWLRDWFGGGKTKAGVVVSEERAQRQTAVAACVRVVSETIGDLGCDTYERVDADNIEPAPYHPYAKALAISPNPEMLAIEFWENYTAYGMLWGRAVAYINRRRNGDIELWPLPPNRVEPAREPVPTGAPGKVTPGPLIGMNVTLNNGERRFVPFRNLMVHTPLGYASNTAGGFKTPIQRHAETIGLALAAEEYGARYFGQGASMPGFIKMPPEAREGQAERAEAKFRERGEGLSRSHLIGVLEGGADWVDVGMNPADSQLIDTRQFGVEEIARAFRCPLSKIQHLLRAHFANIESENISFAVDTVGPWTTRHEQVLRRDVFGLQKYGRTGDVFGEFYIDKLLRGNAVERARAYALAVQWGWATRNDVRRRERMAPLDGLDEPLTPVNMENIAAFLAAQQNDGSGSSGDGGGDGSGDGSNSSTLTQDEQNLLKLARLVSRNGHGPSEPAPTLPA